MALFRPACTNKEGKGAGSKSQRQLEHCCTFTSTTCVFPACLGRLSWFLSFWPGDASSAQSGNISRGEPRCGTTSASSRQPVACCAPALAFCVEQFSALEPCRNKKAFFFVLNNIVSTRDPMQANKFTTLRKAPNSAQFLADIGANTTRHTSPDPGPPRTTKCAWPSCRRCGRGRRVCPGRKFEAVQEQ